MASTFSTEGQARSSARRPWLTIACWVVALVLAGVASRLWLSDGLTTDITFANQPESVAGLDRIGDAGLDDSAGLSETIIVRSNDGRTVDDPAFQAKVATVTEDVRALVASWRAVAGEADESSGGAERPPVVNYYELAAFGLPQAAGLVAEDRQTTLISVHFPGDPIAYVEIGELLDYVESQRGDAFTVLTVGTLSVNERFTEIAEQDLVKGESIGIPMAMVILVVVFGALVAAAVPVVLAVSAVGIALGVTALVGQVWELSVFIQNMITMIGLAVGIDYALFVVERYREERLAGHDKQRAIERAGATSSKAVLFSGGTVVLALAGICLIPTNIFRSLGLGAIIVVVVAVAANLTLVPAMLSLLGDRINWPRRRMTTADAVPAMASEQDAYRGFWGGITHAVMARPIISALLAIALLLAAAWPLLDIRTGFSGLETLPASDVREAFEILTEDFSVGLIDPVEIAVAGPRAETEPAVGRLVEAMNASGLFAPIMGAPEWSEDEQTALVSANLLVSSQSEAAYAAIRTVRGELVPAALAEVPDAQAWVTGTAAFNVDFLDTVAVYTPWVFAFVLALSFLLLTLAFRSIVVPTKAIILNLLSVGAAYGLMVLVFQRGVGADLLGFQQTPTIEAWIPIFLFCVLFGLSMDYHVFLLSRIREHYDQSGKNRESVALGLRATAKIITGAALIMVVVFGGFAAGSLVTLQQVGFGLAVAILIDATIIRTVLVPATMALLGEWNWYMPRWLRWLPDLRVEGELTPSPGSSPGGARQAGTAD